MAQLVTLTEAAAHVGRHKRKLQEWMQRGLLHERARIRTQGSNRTILVDLDDVQHIANTLRPGPKPRH